MQKEDDHIIIILSPETQTIGHLLSVFQNEYDAFASMAKDFVRTVLFPRLADYVPSSTRQGAEAFLSTIRRSRELFEYADNDLGNLPSIWSDYNEGRISLNQAISRSQSAVRDSVQVVGAPTSVQEVVPDVIQNENDLNLGAELAQNLDPSPGITRVEITSMAKLLIIDEMNLTYAAIAVFLQSQTKFAKRWASFLPTPHNIHCLGRPKDPIYLYASFKAVWTLL